MSERIGKAAVRIAFRYVRRRYRREARIALVLGIAVAVVVAYLASREVPEG
ncbi:MAG TPA: hypothetical protein VFS64_04850 [Solirubrobacterales bacterium]|nr:hypothetical protein [Solirubrobacterales bacterium]